MEASKRVWDGLVGHIKALVPRLPGHQATTLGVGVCGALVAGSGRIPAVAEALLLSGMTDLRLPSLERRLSRWLANPRVAVQRIWPACLPALLGAWRQTGPRTSRTARKVLDATPLADRAVVLSVGRWRHGRVLPLAWEVLPGQRAWQEGVHLAHGLPHVGADLVVPVGPRPPALRESALGILLLAARRLHHDLAHGWLLLLVCSLDAARLNMRPASTLPGGANKW
jgi:hypothetical protein